MHVLLRELDTLSHEWPYARLLDEIHPHALRVYISLKQLLPRGGWFHCSFWFR